MTDYNWPDQDKAVGRLLIDLEESHESAGWDQPPTWYCVLITDNSDCTEFAVIPCKLGYRSDVGPAEELQSFADSFAADPDIPRQELSELGTPVAQIVVCESWVRKDGADLDPDVIADYPGTMEGRLALATLHTGRVLVIERIRGDIPEYSFVEAGQELPAEVSVLEPLRNIASAIDQALEEED